MAGPIINMDDLEFEPVGNGNRFEAERASVSRHIGAQMLAYGVVRVPPGKRAWPYHAHLGNEEMFYVLEGEGTLRHAGAEYPIRAGDFICSPPDPDQPHQIINTSDADITYIALGTASRPDIFVYPDSGKYGAFDGDMNGDRKDSRFLVFARESDAAGYFDGEDD